MSAEFIGCGIWRHNLCLLFCLLSSFSFLLKPVVVLSPAGSPLCHGARFPATSSAPAAAPAGPSQLLFPWQPKLIFLSLHFHFGKETHNSFFKRKKKLSYIWHRQLGLYRIPSSPDSPGLTETLPHFPSPASTPPTPCGSWLKSRFEEEPGWVLCLFKLMQEDSVLCQFKKRMRLEALYRGIM